MTCSGPNPEITLAGWLAGFLGANWAYPLLALGAAAMVGCFAIRAWGSSYLSASVVWNPDAQTGALLVDGPFGFVRNPLYLGSVLMALGFGMLATPLGFGIIALGHAIFLPMLMGYEARGLHEKYGAAYEAFALAVPAIVPRLTPAHVEGGAARTPSFSQGLRSEIFSACCAIAMILLIVVGWRYGQWIFYALILGGWLAQRIYVRSPK